MNADIENLVNDCEVCNKFCSTICKEPTISHEVLSHPWEKVGVEYFMVHNRDFLLVIDYYPEVNSMASKTAAATIKAI